jgi:hypothetical protein
MLYVEAWIHREFLTGDRGALNMALNVLRAKEKFS